MVLMKWAFWTSQGSGSPLIHTAHMVWGQNEQLQGAQAILRPGNLLGDVNAMAHEHALGVFLSCHHLPIDMHPAAAQDSVTPIMLTWLCAVTCNESVNHSPCFRDRAVCWLLSVHEACRRTKISPGAVIDAVEGEQSSASCASMPAPGRPDACAEAIGVETSSSMVYVRSSAMLCPDVRVWKYAIFYQVGQHCSGHLGWQGTLLRAPEADMFLLAVSTGLSI